MRYTHMGKILLRWLSYWPLGPAILALAAAAVAVLEQLAPWHRPWRTDQGDLRTDVLHFLGNVLVSQTAVVAYTGLMDLRGPGLWPHEAPLWLQILGALLVFDLGLYAVHRASHGVGPLWKLHAIHHSAPRLYWLNGQRRHLLHEMLEGLPGMAVLGLLGAPGPVLGGAIALVTLHLLLQHANLDYRVGPLRHLLATAEVHRWHHQRRWQEVQGNYAAVFSFWDHLLGTWLPVRGEAPPDVGMDDEPDLPMDWLGQLTWPFGRRARR
jgi:sterol desaturase/sphingolipid hydroxylase (fatty acid hydroxylase superfamily)